MQADGVFAGPVSRVRAEGTVVQFGGAGGLDEGIIVEGLRLAAALLSHQETRIPGYNLVHLLRYQA